MVSLKMIGCLYQNRTPEFTRVIRNLTNQKLLSPNFAVGAVHSFPSRQRKLKYEALIQIFNNG